MANPPYSTCTAGFRELITLYCTLQVEDALVAADTNSSTSSTPIAVAVQPSDMRSYAASPQERFGDALASLDYLLTSELPYEWTEVGTIDRLALSSTAYLSV